ncbi:MAG: alpha/beta fold hydrolase [Anaerolineales bacterium]|nr:alpha/beta fold hydrolase [Anaerolineales bacterium]
MRWLKLLGKVLLALVGFFLALGVGLYLWSLLYPEVQPVALVSNPDPSADYAEARARFDALLASEEARGDLDPKCLPVLLTHGEQTDRAIVLFHGLTACPYQYRELGQDLFDAGYNVFIPRLPRHGLADRTANVLADLTAEELAGAMDPAVDIAAGLGKDVTLAGLSLGGNVAALAGQLRGDLDLAAPMSPALGLRFVPDLLTPALTRIILGLPDFYMWWDPINQANFQAESGYPGYSTHALGEIFRLGLAERAFAETNAPAAENLLMITNMGDPAVNVGAANTLAGEWKEKSAAVTEYEFALLPWLPHDFISPDSPGVKTEVSYPVLEDLLAPE